MLLWLGLALAANGPNPTYASPSALWGELKPTDTVTIAAARDHSAFDEATQPFSTARLTVALEPWNTTVLEATNAGLAVWDLSAAPKNPPRLGSLTSTGFPKPPTGQPGQHFVNDVAAPPPGSSLAALALGSGAGVALVSVADKALPHVVYQDGDPADLNTRSCRDAYAASLGGKPYALVACAGPQPGVAIYDLTAAAAIPIVYQEVTPNASSLFPGVFAGEGRLVSSWLDTGVSKPKLVTRLDGVETFVVTNAATGGGFDLWDVANPAAPRRLGGGAGVDFIGAVAMWRSADDYFVGALTTTQLQLYQVTKVVKETGAAVTLVSWVPATRAYDAETRLQFSRAADGSGFLSYATAREPAHDATSVGLAGEEALYDVSDPAAVRDVTPQPQLVSGAQTTYWGYGYQFGWARPLGGRFAGSFFYRAGWGVFDIHQWTPPINRAPVVTSTPPTSASVGRAYNYRVVAADPEGKALTFVKAVGPAALEFLAPGEVSWVPTAADLGGHPVTITVSDGKNPVPHSWTIVVTSPSDAGATPDAGTKGDAGVGPAKPPRGCGCQAGAEPFAAFAFLLWALRRSTVLFSGRMRLLAVAMFLLAGCKTPEGAIGQGGSQFKSAAALPAVPIQALFEVCWPLNATPAQRVTLVTLSDGRVMFETADGASNATGRCLVEIASSYPAQPPGEREVTPPIRTPSGWSALGYVQLLASTRFGPERGILDPSPLVQACISKGDGLRAGMRFLVSNDPELSVQLVNAEGEQTPTLTGSERCVEAVLGSIAWPGTRSYSLEFESPSGGAGEVELYFPLEGGAVVPLDPEKVKEAIRARSGAVSACWEAALKRRPGLGGGRTVRLRVDDAGAVAHVAVVGNVSDEASTAADYLLDLCLTSAVKTARFPAGAAGDAAYSWVFARRG